MTLWKSKSPFERKSVNWPGTTAVPEPSKGAAVQARGRVAVAQVGVEVLGAERDVVRAWIRDDANCSRVGLCPVLSRMVVQEDEALYRRRKAGRDFDTCTCTASTAPRHSCEPYVPNTITTTIVARQVCFESVFHLLTTAWQQIL